MMIIRIQESAQEPSGSWRLCPLPRSHPGHRQGYVRTNGPRIAASGSSSCREPAGEIPVSPLFALTGPRSTASDVVSPFSRSRGLLRRGPAEGIAGDKLGPEWPF